MGEDLQHKITDTALASKVDQLKEAELEQDPQPTSLQEEDNRQEAPTRVAMAE